MLFARESRSQNLRYLEWILLAVHFGMWLSRPTADLWTLLEFYGGFFWLGWIFPVLDVASPLENRPMWQRLLYVVAGLGLTIAARCAGIDLGLFLFFYLAKSYFLLNRQITFRLCLGMAIPWVVSEYFVELAQFPALPASSSPSLNMVLGTSAVYAAASVFTLMCCAMVLADEQSRYQISELSEQVESLATSLERTRIAREIHDSLGHTLTDLDIQLALAQKLRSHDLDRSFQAVDTAKLLAHQCIEDVSQALARMRQSDFDLNRALIELVEQLRQSAEIQVKWQIDFPQFSVYKSYQIYCIAKEALRNVQKHANAKHVSLIGNIVADGILLEVRG